MIKEDLSQENRAYYDLARHHAWAGTVLLSVLLAIRIFFEMADDNIIPDTIFIILGVIIAFYTLGALLFTFRYRRTLIQKKQETVHVSIENAPIISTKSKKKKVKQGYKLEKEKAKNQVKKEKKQSN